VLVHTTMQAAQPRAALRPISRLLASSWSWAGGFAEKSYSAKGNQSDMDAGESSNTQHPKAELANSILLLLRQTLPGGGKRWPSG
jgi:hypothetical protein